LGFDLIKNDQLWPMQYPPVRPTIDVKRFPSMTPHEGLAMMRRILSSKAPSWEYEREQRVFVALASSRQAKGQYFHRIPSNCLKQVVLGIRCVTTESEVQEALIRGGFTDVTVVKARRCLTHFRVLH
jgi:hypothetical protein